MKQRTFRVDNAQEHRLMLATILKHSRFFIANRSPSTIPNSRPVATRSLPLLRGNGGRHGHDREAPRTRSSSGSLTGRMP